MLMNETIRIEATRARVYEALNDPDVLRRCIPGCESLEKISEDRMTAVVTAKIGPVKAKFSGEVELSDLNPPESYTISGQGKGGAAGFAKGGAAIRLEEDSGATNLHYDVKADVGGKLAQLGSRLIDGVAKHLAKDFFTAFKAEVEGPVDKVEEISDIQPGPAEASEDSGTPGKWWLVGAAIVAALAAYYFTR